jgi:hypothetical protein
MVSIPRVYSRTSRPKHLNRVTVCSARTETSKLWHSRGCQIWFLESYDFICFVRTPALDLLLVSCCFFVRSSTRFGHVIGAREHGLVRIRIHRKPPGSRVYTRRRNRRALGRDRDMNSTIFFIVLTKCPIYDCYASAPCSSPRLHLPRVTPPEAQKLAAARAVKIRVGKVDNISTGDSQRNSANSFPWKKWSSNDCVKWLFKVNY